MSAQAAQRVTLRSGSDVLCDHVRIVNGQVRLFLAPTEDNYLEVGPGDIVRTVMVPDLPAPAPAQATTSVIAAKTTAPAPAPGDLPILLARAAAEHHLDVDLLASVVRAESDGNPWAVSRAGAQGLMQLMPGTATALGVQDSFVPAQNVAGGTAYLDWLLARYHDDIVLALAAYNAGPEAVDRYHGVPPYAETRRYVARVVHDFNQRKRQVLRQQAGDQTAAAEVPSRAANR
jgi:soluble lytic murein transglycosylase-like protein